MYSVEFWCSWRRYAWIVYESPRRLCHVMRLCWKNRLAFYFHESQDKRNNHRKVMLMIFIQTFTCHFCWIKKWPNNLRYPDQERFDKQLLCNDVFSHKPVLYSVRISFDRVPTSTGKIRSFSCQGFLKFITKSGIFYQSGKIDQKTIKLFQFCWWLIQHLEKRVH